MSALHEDKDRKIIPRWRSCLATQAALELAIPKEQTNLVWTDQLAILHDEWKLDPSLRCSGDLLTTACAVADPTTVVDVAQFVLDQAPQDSVLFAVASRLLDDAQGKHAGNPDQEGKYDIHVIRNSIRSAKTKLVSYPRDAHLHLDIARLYSIIGQAPRALSHVRLALALAPNDRHTLRCASRFFVHIDDFEQAHRILADHPGSKSDPWLMAAEIAGAAILGKTSVNMKRARRHVRDCEFAPLDLSELASAVATRQLETSGARGGLTALKKSLVDPTENAVAQAAWATRHFEDLHNEEIDIQLDRSAEAMAWHNLRESRWEESVRFTAKWLDDQRFSGRPATLGCYVASLALDDFNVAENFARAGTEANPREFTHANNLAFCLAHQGRTDEAIAILKPFRGNKLPSTQDAVRLATEGLIAFRTGRVAEGGQLYEKAIAGFVKINDEKRAFLAAMWHANEELEAHGIAAATYVREVLASVDSKKHPDLGPLSERLATKIG